MIPSDSAPSAVGVSVCHHTMITRLNSLFALHRIESRHCDSTAERDPRAARSQAQSPQHSQAPRIAVSSSLTRRGQCYTRAEGKRHREKGVATCVLSLLVTLVGSAAARVTVVRAIGASAGGSRAGQSGQRRRDESEERRRRKHAARRRSLGLGAFSALQGRWKRIAARQTDGLSTRQSRNRPTSAVYCQRRHADHRHATNSRASSALGRAAVTAPCASHSAV